MYNVPLSKSWIPAILTGYFPTKHKNFCLTHYFFPYLKYPWFCPTQLSSLDFSLNRYFIHSLNIFYMFYTFTYIASCLIPSPLGLPKCLVPSSICYGLNYALPNSYVFEDRVLNELMKVKWGYTGRALIPQNWCPCKKRNWDFFPSTCKKRPCEDSEKAAICKPRERLTRNQRDKTLVLDI